MTTAKTPAVPAIEEDEAVLLILGSLGANPKLSYSDRALVYGRALGRLRNAHRDEFERYRRLESARIIDSGDSYP